MERRWLENQWHDSGLTVHREMYCQARNNVTSLITTTKESYYRELITVLVKILLSKATSDCNFVSLSPIFTIFRILSRNDRVDISYSMTWLPWKPFGREIMCYHSYQIRYNILAVRCWIQGVRQWMIHHWKAEIVSILERCGVFVYIFTLHILIITVKLPIIS